MESNASIILVGVRGAGKRTLGLIAATALNWRYMTEDLYFEKTTGKTRAAYIQAYGSSAFHQKNVEVIQSMLLGHLKRCVIECGWASLTSEIHELLRTLCETNPVIHITRSAQQIKSLLHLNRMQSSLLQRADEHHRGCSNYEYYNIQDWHDKGTAGEAQQPTLFSVFRLKEAKAQFCAFLDIVRRDDRKVSASPINRPLSAVPLVERFGTHVVPVLLSDIWRRNLRLEDIELIEDAVEVMVDELSSRRLQQVSETLATLRRHFSIPIIYDVGPSSSKRDEIEGYNSFELRLLRHGLRLGADFLVVNLSRVTTALQKLLSQRRGTRLLGHCEIPWDQSSTEKGKEMYEKATIFGCQIVRIVWVPGPSGIEVKVFDRFLNAFRISVLSAHQRGPALVTYGQGFSGCISGLLSNRILTPVHIPELSRQDVQPSYRLTTKEVMNLRFQRKLLDPLRIYLIGIVPLRVAPTMFKAALDATGLSFEYTSQDTINEERLKELAKDERFGGACITYGYKTILSPFLDMRSQHALAIGAVNTLMPLRSDQSRAQAGKQLLIDRGRAGPIYGWYGENTDWIGMTVCIQRNLSPRNAIQTGKTAGLVIGRGGMARAAVYAMLQLGVKHVLIYHTGGEDPSGLSDHFTSWLRSQRRDNQNVQPFLDSDEEWPLEIEQPTIIISCPPPKASGDLLPNVNAKIPEQWLQSETGGVVLEMVYKPLLTPVIWQIQQLRVRTGRPWVTVDGLEMLTEQGSVQFELLTGRRAPRHTMRREARKAYAQEELRHNMGA